MKIFVSTLIVLVFLTLVNMDRSNAIDNYININENVYTLKIIVDQGSLISPPRTLTVFCHHYTVEDNVWTAYTKTGEIIGAFSDINLIVFVYNNSQIEVEKLNPKYQSRRRNV